MRPARSSVRPRTRECLLDAAERLFAEKGYAATSLRELTGEAGVNLAAVSYHFGSKEGLLRETLARRVGPVNAERLRRLDELERGHPGGVPLEELLRAFVGPPLHHAACSGPRHRLVMRLMAASHSDRAGQQVVKEQFREVVQRFLAAFCRTLPGLSEDQVFCCMMSTVGVMVFFLHSARGAAPPPSLPFDDPEEMIGRIVAFTAAGFRAASPA